MAISKCLRNPEDPNSCSEVRKTNFIFHNVLMYAFEIETRLAIYNQVNDLFLYQVF